MRILEQPVLKFVSATKACIKPFSIKHSASKNIEEFIQFLDATQLLKKIFSPLFQELDLESTKTIQWNLQPKKSCVQLKIVCCLANNGNTFGGLKKILFVRPSLLQ